MAGAYYNKNSQYQPGSTLSTDNQVVQAVRGIDEGWAAGIPPLCGSIFSPCNPPAAQVDYTIVSGPTLVNGVPTYKVVQNTPTPATGGHGRFAAPRGPGRTGDRGLRRNQLHASAGLKATAGVRISDLRTNYTQTQSGPIYGVPLLLFTPTPTHPFPNQPGDPYNNTASGSWTNIRSTPSSGCPISSTRATSSM